MRSFPVVPLTITTSLFRPAREVEQADIDLAHVRAGQVVDDDRVRPAEGEE
jgi:hypothetical protein